MIQFREVVVCNDLDLLPPSVIWFMDLFGLKVYIRIDELDEYFYTPEYYIKELFQISTIKLNLLPPHYYKRLKKEQLVDTSQLTTYQIKKIKYKSGFKSRIISLISLAYVREWLHSYYTHQIILPILILSDYKYIDLYKTSKKAFRLLIEFMNVYQDKTIYFTFNDRQTDDSLIHTWFTLSFPILS